jgi:hypothetical protein
MKKENELKKENVKNETYENLVIRVFYLINDDKQKIYDREKMKDEFENLLDQLLDVDI